MAIVVVADIQYHKSVQETLGKSWVGHWKMSLLQPRSWFSFDEQD
ncbi:hypothetical protein O9929_12910 [Vibrio lentus]|nr:hypothetical protein [Vibrio lentus]